MPPGACAPPPLSNQHRSRIYARSTTLPSSTPPRPPPRTLYLPSAFAGAAPRPRPPSQSLGPGWRTTTRTTRRCSSLPNRARTGPSASSPRFGPLHLYLHLPPHLPHLRLRPSVSVLLRPHGPHPIFPRAPRPQLLYTINMFSLSQGRFQAVYLTEQSSSLIQSLVGRCQWVCSIAGQAR